MTYITTDPESKLLLDKGVIYYADFDIRAGALSSEQFASVENELESLVKSKLEGEGHELQFIQFHPTYEFVDHFSLPGYLDPGERASITVEPELHYLRVYFIINSVTIATAIAILIMCLGIALVAYTTQPIAASLVGIGRAFTDLGNSVVDLGKGVIQEPAKLIKLGAQNWAPILVLIFGFGYFILRK